MEELVYTKSGIVTLVTFENGGKKIIIAHDVYEAMERARRYHGLVMKIEVIGFAGDVLSLVPDWVEM